MTQQLEQELDHFLKTLNFDRLTWNGQKIIAFYADKSFELNEFNRVTSSKARFLEITHKLSGLGPFDYP